MLEGLVDALSGLSLDRVGRGVGLDDAGRLGTGEEWRQVEPAALRGTGGDVGLEQVDAADQLLPVAQAEGGDQDARLLGDGEQVVDDVLDPAGEALAQLRVLRRDPDRAGVQVADAHHHAAHRDQRSGRDPDLVGAEQGGDDDVAAGAHAAVGLEDHRVAQAVGDQRLLGLGEPDLPGNSGVLDRGLRRGPGAAVVAGDDDVVGARLGDAGGDRAHPGLGGELHRDGGARVAGAQVEDQLLQVLDRVDVVVGRGRDQLDAGGREAQRGDVLVHLVAGQLAALAGLRALRDLDLDLVGVRKVVGVDAEAAGRDLPDPRAPLVPVRVGRVAAAVLAALAAVRPGADPVHRHRKRLVRLRGERTEAHRAGGEPLRQIGRGFDLLDAGSVTPPASARAGRAGSSGSRSLRRRAG